MELKDLKSTDLETSLRKELSIYLRITGSFPAGGVGGGGTEADAFVYRLSQSLSPTPI